MTWDTTPYIRFECERCGVETIMDGLCQDCGGDVYVVAGLIPEGTEAWFESRYVGINRRVYSNRKAPLSKKESAAIDHLLGQGNMSTNEIAMAMKTTSTSVEYRKRVIKKAAK